MRYYITTPDGEKGPYEEQDIRGWLRAGTMPRDAPVRAEGESMSRPATSVFPGEAAPPPPAANPAPFGAASGGNVYAPPIQTGGNEWVTTNQGDFWKGFIFGFFCGCIALIISFVSDSMGSETKRGVRIGFVVGLVVGVISRVIMAAAR